MNVIEGVQMKEAAGVLQFWFEQTEPKQWFLKDLTFDALIEERFAHLVVRALDGELMSWSQDADACLALILLLDQFPRHIYRASAQAFAGDAQALELSQMAVKQGWVSESPNMNHRKFYLMPMMHSEELAVQRASLPLFSAHTDENTMRFARRHAEIIERFGRFPHRNQALGRISTQEEKAFLDQPGSSF
ncbi:MAG: DUF924 family protein [Orrella sp.]